MSDLKTKLEEELRDKVASYVLIYTDLEGTLHWAVSGHAFGVGAMDLVTEALKENFHSTGGQLD